MLCFLQDASNYASRDNDGTTHHLNSYSSSQDDNCAEFEDSRHTFTAEQEALIAHVSFSHLVQKKVSTCRCSCDAGYFAANMTADNSPNAVAAGDEGDSSSGEDEGNAAELPTEDTNEPGHHSPGDAVTQPALIPPNPVNEQTPPNQSDEHYRTTPLQPVTAKDAATVGLEADKNPANQRQEDIQGKSKAPQHVPSTVAAKGRHATSHQLRFGKGDSESEEAIDQQQEGPLKTQAEQTAETPGEVNMEARVEEIVETPEEVRLVETMEEATEGSHAFSPPRSLVFADIAHIGSEVTTYPIRGGPSNITVLNIMCDVAIDPHDRHE